ncbi:FG-GAP repeat domain-containing protein [Streptomyces sp. NPDC002867]
MGVHLSGPDSEAPKSQAPSAKAPITAAEALKQARKTGKDVEVVAERTDDSNTYAQPDGKFRLRKHSDTIRAKVDGVWKPIDTTLQRVKGGYAPKAVNDPLLFSAGTSGSERASRAESRAGLSAAATRMNATTDGWSDLVRLTTGGHELVVRWPGSLPAPVVSGSRALYEGVRPGIDLLLTARDGGYSHVLIVHTREAAQDPLLDRLNYQLYSPHLTFRLDETSNVVRAVDADGEEVASSPTPYLWDSAGDPKVTLGESTSPSPTEGSGTALELPGLAGPQPGSHDAVLDASLANDVLALNVNRKVFEDPDTVYPVFVDPSFKGRKTNWTLLYDRYRDSSFFNGQNFNDGTNEARVGYESTTGGLSRSVFTFEVGSQIHRARIYSAYFRALQTYSWGCAPRQYNLHITGTISSTNTWNKQPSWSDIQSDATNGHGYKSGTCPDKWVGLRIDPAAKSAAAGEWPTITLGLRAADEGDHNAWKKFQANGESSPYIEITYNHAPNEPRRDAMKISPGGVCDVEAPFPTIGKSDLTFTGTGTDTDDDLASLHFKIWATDNSKVVLDQAVAVNSSGTASKLIPHESFLDKKSYYWSLTAIDASGAKSAVGPSGTSGYCTFAIDNSVPGSPVIESTDFPIQSDTADVWSKEPFGTAGDFTFKPLNSADGVKTYEYSLNTTLYDKTIAAKADGSAQLLDVQPQYAGPNTIYVKAVDAAGNESSGRAYRFYVKPRSTLDKPGDVTGEGYPDLLAVDATGNLRVYPASAGDVNIHMPGAHANGTLVDDGYWQDSDKHALISHTTDWHPGDGITDVLARMPDGKLYLYPGDGYGSLDVSARLEVLLPEGAPATSALTQIVAAEDVTGDGKPDAVALAGQQLWAFTGYSGASFSKAQLIGLSGWTSYDLIGVRDISGDGVADLLMRGPDTERGLLLRKGKPASAGGVDFTSFASATSGAGGAEVVYGTTGWGRAAFPMLQGTPDAGTDGIPDLWAVKSDGTLQFYPGDRTTHGTRKQVGESGWTSLKTLG